MSLFTISAAKSGDNAKNSGVVWQEGQWSVFSTHTQKLAESFVKRDRARGPCRTAMSHIAEPSSMALDDCRWLALAFPVVSDWSSGLSSWNIYSNSQGNALREKPWLYACEMYEQDVVGRYSFSDTWLTTEESQWREVINAWLKHAEPSEIILYPSLLDCNTLSMI